MTPAMGCLAVEGSPGLLLRLARCADLEGPLRRFLASWPWRPASGPTPALITVRPCKGGWSITAPWLAKPVKEHTRACLFCSLSIELVMGLCLQGQGLMHMHAACVRLHDDLVLIPADNRAGKSSLVSRLSAAGCTVCGDDLVGLLPGGRGFCFGIPPRLRLPLPPSERLRAWVRAHEGEHDRQYGWLDAATPGLAPFGEAGAVTACLSLRRSDDGRTRVTAVPPDPDRLISHCVLHQGAAAGAVTAMRAMAADVPAWELAMGDLDEAAELLLSRPLHELACLADRAAPAPAEPVQVSPADSPCVRPDMVVRRAPCVSLHEGSDGAWLVDAAHDAVFSLNAAGVAVWRLLEHPAAASALAAVVHDALPDADLRVVERDILRLFDELLAEGLVEFRTDA